MTQIVANGSLSAQSNLFSKAKRIYKIKVFLKAVAALSYHPVIYQSTQNCSQFHPFKTPKTDKKKRHGSHNYTTATITYYLCFIDIQIKFQGYFF